MVGNECAFDKSRLMVVVPGKRVCVHVHAGDSINWLTPEGLCYTRGRVQGIMYQEIRLEAALK